MLPEIGAIKWIDLEEASSSHPANVNFKNPQN